MIIYDYLSMLRNNYSSFQDMPFFVLAQMVVDAR